MFSGFFTTEQAEALKELFAPVIKDLVTMIAEKVMELEQLREPKYITRTEAAAMLGVSLPSLHNYTRAGWLTKHRISGRVLYDQREIEEAVEKNLKYRRQ
jgi:predicted site-specific integrase-resolvase